MRRWVGLVTVLLVAGCAAVPAVPTPIGLNHPRSSGHTHVRDSDPGESVIIEADSFERVDKDRLLVFIGRVVVAWQRTWRLYADRIEVYFDETAPDSIFRATAIGNVRIAMSDCRARADRVEYYDDDRRMLLSGNARAWRGREVVSGKELVLALPRVPWGSNDCARAGDKPAPRRPDEASFRGSKGEIKPL